MEKRRLPDATRSGRCWRRTTASSAASSTCLQIMFDLQTHLLPAEDDELRKLALRMGYADAPDRPALEAFSADYRNKTDLNRKMLDHLLHDAFSDDAADRGRVGPGARPRSAAGADGRGAGQVSAFAT